MVQNQKEPIDPEFLPHSFTIIHIQYLLLYKYSFCVGTVSQAIYYGFSTSEDPTGLMQNAILQVLLTAVSCKSQVFCAAA